MFSKRNSKDVLLQLPFNRFNSISVQAESLNIRSFQVLQEVESVFPHHSAVGVIQSLENLKKKISLID